MSCTYYKVEFEKNTFRSYGSVVPFDLLVEMIPQFTIFESVGTDFCCEFHIKIWERRMILKSNSPKIFIYEVFLLYTVKFNCHHQVGYFTPNATFQKSLCLVWKYNFMISFNFSWITLENKNIHNESMFRWLAWLAEPD